LQTSDFRNLDWYGDWGQVNEAISKGGALKAEAFAKAHILTGRQRLLASSG
jgi:hypothetical protein